MKTAEILYAVFQWIGVFAAIITVISVIYDKKRWLTVIASVITAISAIITVATGHYLDNLRTRYEEAQANELAQTKKDLEAIRIQTQPRQLSLIQRQQMFAGLSQRSKGAVIISTLNGDYESYDFAMQIATILHASGWKVTNIAQTVYLGEKPVGIELAVHSKNSIPDEAYTLKDIFDQIGLRTTWRHATGTPEGTFILNVGRKPQ